MVGQTVTVHAEVTPVSPATGTPEGAIQFFVDGNPAGLFVAAGQRRGRAPAQHADRRQPRDHARSTSARSANFITSTSAPITQQVNKAATSTTVTSSAAPSVFGQPVTFTATVAVQAPGAGAPSGTITFTDGSTVLDTVPVSSATNFQATYTTSSLSVAQHVIVATYNGDGSFLGSNGNVIQKVQRAQTSTVVTSSANPAQSGQAVTFTAVVAPVAPGAGLPDRHGPVHRQRREPRCAGDAGQRRGDQHAASPRSRRAPTRSRPPTTVTANFVSSDGILDQGNGQNVTKGATYDDAGRPATTRPTTARP